LAASQRHVLNNLRMRVVCGLKKIRFFAARAPEFPSKGKACIISKRKKKHESTYSVQKNPNPAASCLP
jgi:hypothetical protein